MEVHFLQLLNLAIDPVNLDLIGVDLGLIVLELSDHLFELLSTLFQVRLILVQLLVDIGSALLRQNVLQLNVKLLFLLDKHVFF